MHRHVDINMAMRKGGAGLRVPGVAVTQGGGGAVKNLSVRSPEVSTATHVIRFICLQI